MSKLKKIIIVLLLFLFFPGGVFAQTIGTKAFNDQYSLIVENNVLIYPGLLPDSPLYFLKMLRDRLVGFSVKSPVDKAEYYINLADKRLAAGIFLFIEKKYSLSSTTIMKGQNYLDDSLKEAKLAKEQGYDTRELRRKIDSSLLKHKAVLKKMDENGKGSIPKEFFRVSQDKLSSYQSRTASILSSK